MTNQIITNQSPKSILSPGMATRNAWARTLTLTSNDKLENKEADNVKNQMKKILENAQTFEEIRYVNEVYSAVESTFRNLASARNHFNLNLQELKERRTKRIADLDSTTTVSSDFQSLITRISAITFGGTGGLSAWGFLVNFGKWVWPDLPNVETVVLPLFLVVGASIGYIIHNWWSIPRKADSIQRELIKTDYDSILYYRLYVERAKRALENLYDTTNTLYKNIFNVGNYPGFESSQAAVVNVLKSMDMSEFTCGYIDEHSNNEKIKIDNDVWVVCETGIQKEECKYRICDIEYMI